MATKLADAEGGEVDEFYLKVFVQAGDVVKPLGDGGSHATGTCAADDDLKYWFGQEKPFGTREV